MEPSLLFLFTSPFETTVKNIYVYIYKLFITLGDGSIGPPNQPIDLAHQCATDRARPKLWPRARPTLTHARPMLTRTSGPSHSLIDPTRP
jgi:hypothetical protein